MRHTLIAFLCLSLLVAGCQSSKETSIEEAVSEVFGKPYPNGTGLASVVVESGVLIIEANLQPTRTTTIEEQVGFLFGSRLKRLYDTVKEVDQVKAKVNLSYSDQYGNITWKPGVSFEFSRAIYQKINWNEFNVYNLLKVAENVTRH